MAGAAAAGGHNELALAFVGALATTVAVAGRGMGRALRADAAARRHLSSLVDERTAELEQQSRDLASKMKELEAARTHLGVTERLAAVGRLASGIAHEINSPLAVTLTNVAWLRETLPGVLGQSRLPQGSPPAPELLAALTEAEEAAQRMARIVRDLLDFAQDRADPAGASDLVAVLQHVQRLVGHEVRARARLAIEVPDVPVLVRGSSARLGQLFAHLLLHAAHAIDEGHADDNEVRVVLRAEEGARVEVRDTGRGLTPEALTHVFDPFYAAWNGEEASGGLGLGVCHGIASALGGGIEVESAPGHGSVYRVRFPPAASESRLALAPRAGSRPRVLVVDDEPLVCASLYRVLSRDFDVVPHTSARHALALVRAGEPFDIVLCDLMMPEMSGEAFHAELSQLRPKLAAEVVFLSGGAFTPGAQEFLQAVPNLCIQKPFEPAELITLLSERCRSRTTALAPAGTPGGPVPRQSCSSDSGH
jgi:signal transduction histidine kinase/ActR/RegA family two-component response regulator